MGFSDSCRLYQYFYPRKNLKIYLHILNWSTHTLIFSVHLWNTGNTIFSIVWVSLLILFVFFVFWYVLNSILTWLLQSHINSFIYFTHSLQWGFLAVIWISYEIRKYFFLLLNIFSYIQFHGIAFWCSLSWNFWGQVISYINFIQWSKVCKEVVQFCCWKPPWCYIGLKSFSFLWPPLI